ncbi:MAG: hypothetical protein PVF96_02090 [Candidatus Bathyarchaeota archaeon]|jgi:hypothetical protein
MSNAKKQVKKQSCVCSNPDCRKVFAEPIIAQDIGSEDTPSYPACPFCLTEFLVEKTQITHKKPEKATEEPSVKKKIHKPEEEKPPQESLLDEKQECRYHFGYLGNRSKNEEIPDECMTCEKIVNCMLKNVGMK